MRRRVLLVAAASAALVRRTAARDHQWSALHEGGVAILLRHAQTEARLAFPKHRIEPWPALNSFFDDRAAEPRSTRQALTRILALQPPANVVFVTHHVNIAALTGAAVGSGEAVLVRPHGSEARVLGRLQL